MISPDQVYPVIVVGGGPVGMALAGDLGWRGVSCLLLERGNGPSPQPKIDLVGVRTMEFCRRWGLVPQVQNCPYPNDYPQDIIFLKDLVSGDLVRDPFPAMRDDKPLPQSPEKKERCPQNMFDPILKAFLSGLPTVDLRYRSTVVSVTQETDHAAVTVEGPEGSATYHARYVVACDGGSSPIREALEIGMSGRGVLTFTTNVLFRAPAFHDFHDVAPGYRYIFLDEGGIVWATVVAINGRDEFRLSIVGDSTRQTLTQEEVTAAIKRLAGHPFEFDILSIFGWKRRELVADAYGKGRVFLCGDAAHVMSPTGGFGMNTGIADAVDLSWKLAAVLEGWGGERLLGSYEDERQPVAVRNVGEAGQNFDRMTSAPQGLGLAAVARHLKDAMAPEWNTLHIHLGHCYAGSPVIVPDGTEPPVQSGDGFVQSAVPGCRAPHAWLADGRSTLDLFGRGFVLLRIGAEAPDCAEIDAAARERNVPLQIVTLEEPETRKLFERALVLVRPDGHVAWRGDAAPAVPGDLLDRVRGAWFTARKCYV